MEGISSIRINLWHVWLPYGVRRGRSVASELSQPLLSTHHPRVLPGQPIPITKYESQSCVTSGHMPVAPIALQVIAVDGQGLLAVLLSDTGLVDVGRAGHP